jgi:hypothetical protein
MGIRKGSGVDQGEVGKDEVDGGEVSIAAPPSLKVRDLSCLRIDDIFEFPRSKLP